MTAPKQEYEFPFSIKSIRYVLWPFANKERAVWLALLILLTSYIYSCYISSPSPLTSSSSLLIVIGLILTIKNSYLIHLQSVEKWVQHKANEVQASSAEEQLKNAVSRDIYFSQALDEGVGVVLVITGTILNAFGSAIPLISLCP